MTSRKALMFLHAYYKEDPRPRREAEALAADGWSVEVICLNKGQEADTETCEGVDIIRAPVSRSENKSVGTLLVEYIRFFFACIKLRARKMWAREYDVIVSHNMPNFLVFAAFPGKLRGTPVILDVHDSMLGVFENTLAKSGGTKAKILKLLLRLEERLSFVFANGHMTVTEKFAAALSERSGKRNFFLLHNAPDTSRLDVKRKEKTETLTRILHHGNIHERNGVQNVFHALKRRNEGGQRFILEVQGHGPYWEELRECAKKFGVLPYCEFGGPFTYETISPRLEMADVGLVIPTVSEQMQQALHVKFLEYAACRVPIIARRLETLNHYFPEDCAFYIDTEEDLDNALEEVRNSPAVAQARAARAFERLQEISWDAERPKFLEFLESFCQKR